MSMSGNTIDATTLKTILTGNVVSIFSCVDLNHTLKIFSLGHYDKKQQQLTGKNDGILRKKKIFV